MNERDKRERLIAEDAYRRAERRRFEAGHELEDWLAAEAQIDHGPFKRDGDIR